jgi:hypothetical protein
MVKKKTFIIGFIFLKRNIKNNLNLNSTEQIITYYTLTKLLGLSIKSAFYICLFL